MIGNKTIRNFKELNQENTILDLYQKHFPKVRNTIIKYFYFRNLQYIMDIDDLTAILDQAFINAYKTYHKVQNQYPFEKHFYIVAKGKIIDAYRAYNTNKKKILKIAFHENELDSFICDFYNQYSEENWTDLQLTETDKYEQIRFIQWFYHNIKNNNLNKKILYYKLKYYNLDDIATILKVSKKTVSKHWSYLISRMRSQFQTWLKVNKK